MSIAGGFIRYAVGAFIGKYAVTILMAALLGGGGLYAFNKLGTSKVDNLDNKIDKLEIALIERNATIVAFSRANKDNESTINFLTKKTQKLQSQYKAEAKKSEERRLLAIAESNRRIKAEKFNAEIIRNNPEISLWLNTRIPANGLQ